MSELERVAIKFRDYKSSKVKLLFGIKDFGNGLICFHCGKKVDVKEIEFYIFQDSSQLDFLLTTIEEDTYGNFKRFES